MDWLQTHPVAHRGLHSPTRPENTIGAVRAALDGSYAIECDVRLTSDDVPVVFHDTSLDRMTDVDRPISETSWDTLGDLSIQGTDYGIPRLETVLEAVDGRVPLLIELKGGGRPGALERIVAGTLDEYAGPVAVQSFNPLTVRWFRQHRPATPRGQLLGSGVGPFESVPLGGPVLDRLPLTWPGRPDFLACSLDSIPSPAVERQRRPVLSWTVRTESQLRRATQHVDNVIFENVRP